MTCLMTDLKLPEKAISIVPMPFFRPALQLKPFLFRHRETPNRWLLIQGQRLGVFYGGKVCSLDR